MLRYDDVLVGAKVVISWDATKILPDGVTMTSVTCTIEKSEYSDVDDADPSALKSGTASVNTEAVVIDGETVATGNAGMQLIQPDTDNAGVEYLITWMGDFSDGIQRDGEQGLLTVRSRLK